MCHQAQSVLSNFSIDKIAISYLHYPLFFKNKVGTSRGYLERKESWLIKIQSLEEAKKYAIGEWSIIPNLSLDDTSQIKTCLETLSSMDKLHSDTIKQFFCFPALKFALETAVIDYLSNQQFILFDTSFSQNQIGIPINGLVWMGDTNFMEQQVQTKIKTNYSCIKLKIGSKNIHQELQLIKSIRDQFSPDKLEIRVDANGAFSIKEVYSILEQLAKLSVHSIEQPIAVNQWREMKKICRENIIPIVLDEELIGLNIDKENVLDTIEPQYIILKPSLLGGFLESEEWIKLATKRNIDWWVTSALESNVGLNAIAQWTSTYKLKRQQGLGTGSLYKNNIVSPLEIRDESLWFNRSIEWEVPNF